MSNKICPQHSLKLLFIIFDFQNVSRYSIKDIDWYRSKKHLFENIKDLQQAYVIEFCCLYLFCILMS
jgi:hypothetical protein